MCLLLLFSPLVCAFLFSTSSATNCRDLRHMRLTFESFVLPLSNAIVVWCCRHLALLSTGSAVSRLWPRVTINGFSRVLPHKSSAELSYLSSMTLMTLVESFPVFIPKAHDLSCKASTAVMLFHHCTRHCLLSVSGIYFGGEFFHQSSIISWADGICVICHK